VGIVVVVVVLSVGSLEHGLSVPLSATPNVKQSCDDCK